MGKSDVKLVAVELYGESDDAIAIELQRTLSNDDYWLRYCNLTGRDIEADTGARIESWWVAEDDNDVTEACELCSAFFVPQGRQREVMEILCSHNLCVHAYNGVACPSGKKSADHLRNLID